MKLQRYFSIVETATLSNYAEKKDFQVAVILLGDGSDNEWAELEKNLSIKNRVTVGPPNDYFKGS